MATIEPKTPTRIQLLRTIILECGLEEESKWGVPCYTFNKKNVLLLSASKQFCAISFLKGSLLSDEHGILVKPGPNSQAARYIKITKLGEIILHEEIIKNTIYQAIEVEKAGLEVTHKKSPEPLPEELEKAFDEDPAFKTAFEALTPGRQRGYILHISAAKQAKTRIARIEKNKEKIFNGIGLNDHYGRRKK